jgi:hypothetical protein
MQTKRPQTRFATLFFVEQIINRHLSIQGPKKRRKNRRDKASNFKPAQEALKAIQKQKRHWK